MKIKTTYEFKSYSKLMANLFYKQKRGIFVVIIGVIMLCVGCFFLVVVPDSFPGNLFFFLCGLFLVSLPYLASKLNAKRSFFSNKMLQDEIVMCFIDDKIITTGKTFKTEMMWSGLYKVQEVKDWFLLYHSKRAFLMVPKDALGDKYFAFVDLIKSQKGLHYKLLEK